ncbi:MAG TPA: sugar transferase [Microlunatus sp.]|nr:sugar transferase [Microlunatus sp.]
MAVLNGASRVSQDVSDGSLVVSEPDAFGQIDHAASSDFVLDDHPTVRVHRLRPQPPITTAQHSPTPLSDGVPVIQPEEVVEAKRVRFSAWSHRYVARIVVADALIGGVLCAVLATYSNTLSDEGTGVVALLTLVGAILWTAAIAVARGYHRAQVGFGSDEIRSVLRAGVALVFVGAFPAGLMQETALLKLVVVGTPAAVVLSLIIRYVARKSLHRQQAKGRNMRHVIVVGTSTAAKELKDRLNREPHGGMKVVGVCVPSDERGKVLDLGMPVLGELEDAALVVQQYGCDAVAVTSDDATRHNYLRELSWSLEGTGVEMLVDPGLVEVAGPRMHIRPLMGFPLLHIEEPHFTGWRRVAKRAADILITSIGLVIISPLMIGIGLAVKFQDGGPVIFRQTRVGRGGQPFSMLKFRSMVIDAEARKASLMESNEGKGGLFKLSHDPRITRLGKFLRDFSLDELPQLFNVLNGSMSLVGPRPHLAQELAQMPREASRRSLVTPGLTGLWQVSGRSDLEGDDAIRLDLRYVENWSFTLDLLILWKTASAVLAKRGAR